MWAKNKKQDSGNGRENCRILWGFFKSTTNCAAQLKLWLQSWLDWHWGGEIKLQGRSEKQPAGRCGRAHSELLKWPESIVKGGDSPRSQQADFQQVLGLLRYINAMSRAVKWQKCLPKWRQPAHLTSLYCGLVGKKEEAPSALFLY